MDRVTGRRSDILYSFCFSGTLKIKSESMPYTWIKNQLIILFSKWRALKFLRHCITSFVLLMLDLQAIQPIHYARSENTAVSSGGL